MSKVNLVIVTGSLNNVKQASISGTPAIGVGQGNVTSIIDETADLSSAVKKIKASKTFDNATSCSSENNLIILEEVYDQTIKLMTEEKAILLNKEEKIKLQNSLWIDGKLNRKIIAKSADVIIKEIDLKNDDNFDFILVEKLCWKRVSIFRRETFTNLNCL
jgi:sulfoacetaldehyde dehydrogenase